MNVLRAKGKQYDRPQEEVSCSWTRKCKRWAVAVIDFRFRRRDGKRIARTMHVCDRHRQLFRRKYRHAFKLRAMRMEDLL